MFDETQSFIDRYSKKTPIYICAYLRKMAGKMKELKQFKLKEKNSNRWPDICFDLKKIIIFTIYSKITCVKRNYKESIQIFYITNKLILRFKLKFTLIKLTAQIYYCAKDLLRSLSLLY